MPGVGAVLSLTGVDNPVHKFPPPGAHPNRGCHPDKRIGTLIPMTTTETQFVGIAAADDLDILNSRDDFEPSTDVDTDALDTALDARTGARVLTKRLDALVAHLSAGGDATTAEGLQIEIRMIVERLDAITAWAL